MEDPGWVLHAVRHYASIRSENSNSGKSERLNNTYLLFLEHNICHTCQVRLQAGKKIDQRIRSNSESIEAHVYLPIGPESSFL
jgi:hypothetical protein